MWLTRGAANLAIRTKILLSFAFILALLAGLGGIAMQRSGATNAAVGQMSLLHKSEDAGFSARSPRHQAGWM